MILTFIGNGNMAKSLIKGLIKEYQIEVYGRTKHTLNILQEEIPNIDIKIIKDVMDIDGKNIILCVKPNSLDDLITKLQGKANAIYSVLAGTKIETLKNKISSKYYIRTMPNLSATYLKSMTTITGNEDIKDDALKIFNNIGSTLWVKTQKELDIATGIAGSGPAFLALIAESLADGGVKAGLSRDNSNQLVQGLFEGFVPLIKNEKPADIKDAVMSPGGTTAAGYAVLEEKAVRTAMIQTIQKAYEKTIELGKN